MTSTLAQVRGTSEHRRGSIYQSSNAVSKWKAAGVFDERRKIKSLCGGEISLTFPIIDCLSELSTNEGSQHSQQKKSPQSSLNANQNFTPLVTNSIFPNSREFQDPSCFSEDLLSAHNSFSSDGFLEICVEAEDTELKSVEESVIEYAKSCLVEGPKFRCGEADTHESDDSIHSERYMIYTPVKAFSEKTKMTDLPCQLEFDCYKASPRACLTPKGQVLDPVMKSMSRRNLSSVTAKEIDSQTNKAFRRSLLRDFSKTSHKTECSGSPIKKDASQATTPSPAHLLGFLKVVHKHGMPFFEFSVTDLGDVLSAKTWRTEDTFNWVYTFQSLNGKKKRDGRHTPSSLVGQMQVSCYLCSKIRNGGSLHNSTVTEFVSYDLAPMRRGFAAAQESSYCSPSSIRPTNDHVELNGGWNTHGCRKPPRHAFSKDDSNTLDLYPWGHMDLLPHLETAAIVIEVPFEKRESLKEKVLNKVCGREDITVSNFSAINRSDHDSNRSGLVNVKVVAPSGTHGLPNTEEGSPSPLLDRWRTGGGCDCGGWDMSCPITVFHSAGIENSENYPFSDNPWPFELFVQGPNEKLPALSITLVRDGEYRVNFHAQFSTLQAFSICVALLHSVEVPTAVGHERSMQRMRVNSLKTLLDEKIQFSLEAVTEEERREATKKPDKMPPCLVLEPPFSPMGRV